MAASKVLESFEEEVSCSLCFEKYDNDNRLPKMLPCQHTYCYLCLLQYESSSLEQGFHCPSCKEHVPIDHTGIQALPNNLATISLLERIKTFNITETKVLTHVKNDRICPLHHKEADNICLPCNELLCGKCMMAIVKGMAHTGHDVVDLDEAYDIRRKELAKVTDFNQFYEEIETMNFWH